MKQRKWMVVMACLIALTLALAGCGGGGGGDKKPAAAPAKTQNINIATATTGGVYYPLGNAMAQMFNQKIPGIKVSAQATAGTPQNILLMQFFPKWENQRKLFTKTLLKNTLI